MQKKLNKSLSRRNFLKTAAVTGASAYFLSGIQAQDIKKGGTMRIAFPETPNEFDPALVSAFPEYNTNYAVYDGLVRVDASLTPQPQLATSWEATDDGLTWTFNLREGVTFHDGSSFSAEDAAYSINRLIDEEVGSPLRASLAIIDNAEAVDASTLQLNLSSPNGDLVVLLGSPQARMVQAGSTSDSLREGSNGTGPFTLVEHVPGSHTLLAANGSYWDEGKPYLAEVRMIAMPEASTQVAAISGGQVDFLFQVGTENIPVLDRNRNVEVLEVESGAYQTIAMDARVAPFDDNRVREAFKLCVDRGGMLVAVLQGRGLIGNDHPIPAFNGFAKDIPQRQQDIARAKELLAEAGYPDGLDVTLTSSTVRAGMMESAVAFQEMAKDAGINVEINRVPPDNYWGEHWMKSDFFCSNWGMRPSIDETLTNQFYSGAKWNEGKYDDPDLDAAIDAGRSATDPAARAAHYGEAQQILHDSGGVVVSYFKPVIQAQSTKVQGFEAHPASWIYLHETWLS